jgi:hypothetical protein
MKNIKIRILICILFGSVAFSCTNIIDPNKPADNSNRIIFMSSFESNDQASMGNWSSPGPPFVKFSNDVPPLGGNFSVILKAADQGASIKTAFSIPEGSYNYKFSLWGKNPEDAGEACLYLLSFGKELLKGRIFIDSKDWQYYSISENLNAAEGDSMKIVISGAYSNNNHIGVTWVDICMMELNN